MQNPDLPDGPWPPLTVTRRSLLVDGSDREFRHLVESMVLFATRLQDIRAGLAAQMQVSPPQYKIVMALARTETPEMTATALASALGVSTAFIVTEAAKLGELGYVKRRKNPNDARSFLIGLTALARQRVLQAAPLMSAINDMLFEGIDRARMLQLAQTTQILLAGSESALDALDTRDTPSPRTAGKKSPNLTVGDE